MSHAANVARIKTVYDALEEIVREVVFVGGATVSLYADRPATESRPTEDVRHTDRGCRPGRVCCDRRETSEQGVFQ